MAVPANKVIRVGNQLQMNGQPFRAVGFDIWGMAISSWSHPADYNGNSIAQLAGYLADLRTTAPNINTIRVWMYQQFAINSGVFDYSGFDNLLATCAQYGFKVVASLEDSWSYERTGSQSPALTTAWFNGGYTNTTLTAEQIPYRQWAINTVTRYANDPRILFWELVNEGNNMTATFVQDMCALLHSIDPNTPISDGFGWSSTPQAQYYGVSNGFDILDFHYYLDFNQTDTLAIAQVGATAGVPWYFGEYGNDRSTGTQRAAIIQQDATNGFNNGAVGFLYWQYSEISGDSFKITTASDPAVATINSFATAPAPTPTPTPTPTPPPPTPTPTPPPVIQVRVPYVAGEYASNALYALHQKGFQTQTSPARNPLHSYKVRSTSPGGGALVNKGSMVTLYIYQVS